MQSDQIRRSSSGFTLIEMLVTLTIFGLVLSSVVVGLRTGILTWQSIRSSESRNSAVEQAFDQIRSDIQHLAIISEDIAPIVENALEQGGESLAITRLGDRPAQSRGQGSAWSGVEYRVNFVGPREVGNLIRTVRPMVGLSAIEISNSEQELLDDVDSVSFDYVTQNATAPLWEDSASLPSAVQISLRLESGRTYRRLMIVPAGYFQGLAGP